MEMIDLSHVIDGGMVTYKGLPAPLICDHLSRVDSRSRYESGTEFQIGRIDMVGNTGTYIDTPFHRYHDGFDLAALPLEKVSNVEGILIRVRDPEVRVIDKEYFESFDVAGRAVLICTGWSKHWRTDQYFEDHPYLTECAANYLSDGGAHLVGIDSHNIDDTRGRARPVHSILLAAGIPIVEHLTHLELLPPEGFRFFAVPPKVSGMGTFPVRAYALVKASKSA